MRISDQIRAYLDGVPEPHRSMLEHLHGLIKAEAPEAEEAIAYGIPTFRLDGNLVHYAAFKNHCSFFPGSTAHNDTLKEELAGYKLSKGTIQFTEANPLSDALVRKIVRLRIADNRERAAAKKAGTNKPASGRASSGS